MKLQLIFLVVFGIMVAGTLAEQSNQELEKMDGQPAEVDEEENVSLVSH